MSPFIALDLTFLYIFVRMSKTTPFVLKSCLLLLYVCSMMVVMFNNNLGSKWEKGTSY